MPDDGSDYWEVDEAAIALIHAIGAVVAALDRAQIKMSSRQFLEAVDAVLHEHLRGPQNDVTRERAYLLFSTLYADWDEERDVGTFRQTVDKSLL